MRPDARRMYGFGKSFLGGPARSTPPKVNPIPPLVEVHEPRRSLDPPSRPDRQIVPDLVFQVLAAYDDPGPVAISPPDEGVGDLGRAAPRGGHHPTQTTGSEQEVVIPFREGGQIIVTVVTLVTDPGVPRVFR